MSFINPPYNRQSRAQSRAQGTITGDETIYQTAGTRVSPPRLSEAEVGPPTGAEASIQDIMQSNRSISSASHHASITRTPSYSPTNLNTDKTPRVNPPQTQAYQHPLGFNYPQQSTVPPLTIQPSTSLYQPQAVNIQEYTRPYESIIKDFEEERKDKEIEQLRGQIAQLSLTKEYKKKQRIRAEERATKTYKPLAYVERPTRPSSSASSHGRVPSCGPPPPPPPHHNYPRGYPYPGGGFPYGGGGGGNPGGPGGPPQIFAQPITNSRARFVRDRPDPFGY